jgi:hypothetical protein
VWNANSGSLKNMTLNARLNGAEAVFAAADISNMEINNIHAI